MLQTHLHRRGQIPTSTHPFVKQGQAIRLMQPEKETSWFHRFISLCSFIPIAILEFLQHQYRRHP